MRPIRVGHLLIAIGVIHTAFGPVVGAPYLMEILQDGVFNTVPDDAPWRMAIVWFELFGVVVALMGAAWAWAERHVGALPIGMAMGLAALGVIGVVLMPISGFWLILGVAGLAGWRARRAHRLIPSG
ncbi:MAG: DUF6463 family protein [Myxococcota bacterium]